MWWSRKKASQVDSGEASLSVVQAFDRLVFIDVAAHYLAAAGISAVRRTKKSDNNRISRAVGAAIVNDTGDLKDEDVGTGCGLFEIRKIGDEYVHSHRAFCSDNQVSLFILRQILHLLRSMQDPQGVHHYTARGQQRRLE